MRFMIIVKATKDSEAGVMPGEEAVEWARRYPNPTQDGSDCEIEVRQMFELEDFGTERRT